MQTTDDTDRADRLLGKMDRVLSHDLPNQIVAVQSLVQLLEMDKMSRLGPEGRECISRLHRVARRAHGMVRFLKELSRLHAPPRRVEEVAPATVIRELRAELHQQVPGTVEWSTRTAGRRQDGSRPTSAIAWSWRAGRELLRHPLVARSSFPGAARHDLSCTATRPRTGPSCAAP